MKKKTIVLVFFAWIMMGFRVYPGKHPWNITLASPRLWVKWCSTYTLGANDLGATDPLYGQTPTFQQVVDSIYTDFYQVPGSFIELYDAATDPTYNTTVGALHTIDICTAGLTVAGGEARPV